MALQFPTSELTKKFCSPKPTRCSGDLVRILNFNKTETLWKSTEPAKGTFYLNLNTEITPEGAFVIFNIKQGDGTIISRIIKRGAAYVLTVDQAVEATVQAKNGPPNQFALVVFAYCDQNLIKAKAGNCCSPPLECDEFLLPIFQWTTEPLFTWETFFPVKGTLFFYFTSIFDLADNPSATIKVDRFNKPTIIKTIPLSISNTDNYSEIPFVLTADEVRKVTITSSGIDPNESWVNTKLCYQEESNALCCHEPFKCEDSFYFFPLSTPTPDIKIWESVIPVKGTYSIVNGFNGTLILNIHFNNQKTLEKTLVPGGGFAITAEDVKEITIKVNPSSTLGFMLFRYCIQDMDPEKVCQSLCCTKPLQCNIVCQTFDNPQGQTIPLWISKTPVDGEILFSIEGQPQQKTKLIIKRFNKPDIIKIVEGENIFAIRTTDMEGIFFRLDNGNPNNNTVETNLCIQEKISQSEKPFCCPEPI